jgi:8-oxo-dGTP diphosphatase
MGTILAMVSIFLSALLFPLGLLMTFFINLYKRQWILSFRRLDSQFLSIATSIDASGNVVCKDLFNLILKKKGGYGFGKRKETISSALGKNQRDDTLTGLGRLIASILNKIETDHCLKSIDSLV